MTQAEVAPWHTVAVHEAGHAIVAYKLGQRLGSFELSVRAMGDRWGFGGHVSLPDDPPANDIGEWDEEDCLKCVTIMLAGHAAESIQSSRTAGFAIDGSLLTDPRDMQGANEWLDRLQPTPRDVERGVVLEREWERARDLLTKSWPAVMALANAGIATLEIERSMGTEFPISVTINGAELRELLEEEL